MLCRPKAILALYTGRCADILDRGRLVGDSGEAEGRTSPEYELIIGRE